MLLLQECYGLYYRYINQSSATWTTNKSRHNPSAVSRGLGRNFIDKQQRNTAGTLQRRQTRLVCRGESCGWTPAYLSLLKCLDCTDHHTLALEPLQVPRLSGDNSGGKNNSTRYHKAKA